MAAGARLEIEISLDMAKKRKANYLDSAMQDEEEIEK